METKSTKRKATSFYEEFLNTFDVKNKFQEMYIDTNKQLMDHSEKEEKRSKEDLQRKKPKLEEQEEILPEDEGIKYERVENPEDEVYVPSEDEDEDEVDADQDQFEDDSANYQDEIHIQKDENASDSDDKVEQDNLDENIANQDRKAEEMEDLDNDIQGEDDQILTHEKDQQDPFVSEILKMDFTLKDQRFVDQMDKQMKKYDYSSTTQSKYFCGELPNHPNNSRANQMSNHFELNDQWLQTSFIKERLQKSLASKTIPEESIKVFSLLNTYRDLLYCDMSDAKRDDVRNGIMIHILNHIMKSRDIEMRHTRNIHEKIQREKIRRREEAAERQLKKEQGLLTEKKPAPSLPDPQPSANTKNITTINLNEYDDENDNEDMKDQGFTRPKVLIIAPFKYNAFMIVQSLLSYLPKEIHVENFKRFKEEYNEEEDDANEDGDNKTAWKKVFPGNNDDCFRLGLSFKRKSITIFTDFYNSDIILASPIGLKQVIGEEGDRAKNRNYDFLSSIEIFYVENTDIIDYQNWSHLQSICKCLNKPLKKDHGTDYSRVKPYVLEGYSEYMRQTIVTSRYMQPKMKSLFSVFSHNYRGAYEIRGKYEGSVAYVYNKNRQLFVRLDAKKLMSAYTERLNYFKSTILPFILKKDQTGILLYVEEYYDYINIRNLMMDEVLEEDVAVINEYLPSNECMRSATYFKNRTVRILLYSGRYHYFRRYPVHGVNTIFFIGVPREPSFYHELVNNMNYSPLSISVTTLYTQFEGNELERVVGTDRYKVMIKGKRSSYVFC